MDLKTEIAKIFDAEASKLFRVDFKDGEVFVMRQVSTALMNEEGILCGTIVEVINTVTKHPFKADQAMDFEFKDIAKVTNLETGLTISL
jgi:hypothetical protein